MEHIDSTDFSDIQKEIITLRVGGMSLSDIIARFNLDHGREMGMLTKQALSHCLERSAVALKWEKGMKGGGDHYLSGPDFAKLKSKVLQSASDDEHLDPESVLNEAYELKTARIKEGILFLESTGSPNLAIKLEAEPVSPPVRSWVNKRLKELESSLKYKRLIDVKRIIACTPEHLSNYHTTHAELIRSTPAQLLFGADEVMMETSGRTKVLSPNANEEIIGHELAQMPHLTSMCCNNVLGEKVPPFIILNGLATMPVELKPFVDRGQIWLSSSPSGWQTRDTFLYWTICFINWLSTYRLTLSEEIRSADALLIMDGHVSRENPVALSLLSYHHINVLILPSHTSHVLQMFDVILASQLKRKFSKIFRPMLSKVDRSLAVAPQLRQFAVLAFIDAWSQVCNLAYAMTAAKITGTYPCCLEPILNSRFVRPLTPQLERIVASRRPDNDFTINEKVITSEAIINTINNKLKEVDRWKHLCLRDNYPSYPEYCNEVIGSENNACRFFGRLPPYVLEGFAPCVF